MGCSRGFSPWIKDTSPSQHLHLLTTVSLLPCYVFPLSKYCFLFTLGPCSFCHGPSLNESLTKAGFWVRGKQNHGESTKIFQLQQLCFNCSDAGNFNTNSLSFHTWWLIEIQRSCRARQLPRALQRGLIDREHIFNRLRSLTHLLSNINPSVITVGNSSLLKVFVAAAQHKIILSWGSEKLQPAVSSCSVFLELLCPKDSPHSMATPFPSWNRYQARHTNQRRPYSLTPPRQEHSPAQPYGVWQCGSTPASELAALWGKSLHFTKDVPSSLVSFNGTASCGGRDCFPLQVFLDVITMQTNPNNSGTHCRSNMSQILLLQRIWSTTFSYLISSQTENFKKELVQPEKKMSCCSNYNFRVVYNNKKTWKQQQPVSYFHPEPANKWAYTMQSYKIWV